MQASAPAPLPKVELRHVDLRYFGVSGETEALRDISLAVSASEFVAIIGQSGCGKSTLLSLISGILAPTGGVVLIDGQPVTGPTRKVGYMLQQDCLFEWRSILDNAVLGAKIQGADMRRAKERASQLLTRYGLGQFLHHPRAFRRHAPARRARAHADDRPGRGTLGRAVFDPRFADAPRARRRGRRDPAS
jgi:NitT/TauT family transport system ATP-binding protein